MRRLAEGFLRCGKKETLTSSQFRYSSPGPPDLGGYPLSNYSGRQFEDFEVAGESIQVSKNTSQMI